MEWELDIEGNWTGEWITDDDRAHENILDEDVGYKLSIENIGLVSQGRRQLLTADESSFYMEHDNDDGQETHLSGISAGASVNSGATSSAASGGSGQSG